MLDRQSILIGDLVPCILTLTHMYINSVLQRHHVLYPPTIKNNNNYKPSPETSRLSGIEIWLILRLAICVAQTGQIIAAKKLSMCGWTDVIHFCVTIR